jgi:3-keto-disaccharide hydrolase
MTIVRTMLMVAIIVVVTITSMAGFGVGQEKPKIGYKDTPMLPGGKWHVHDGDRPIPPIVTPGKPGTQDIVGTAPSDAVVLFDGTNLDHWRNRSNGPAGWTVDNGALVEKPGAGDILSRDEFGDCQLHLEFASPVPPRSRDQGRGNSGVMFFGRYEIQILDSYDNLTYADGQASAIYGQFPPQVNASRPPGQWQTYDIVFTAPRFKTDGMLESPAYLTMLHNGVLVHNHVALLGPMHFRGLPKYQAHGPAGPLLLQDHGNPVRFRNIWVRRLAGDAHNGE